MPRLSPFARRIVLCGLALAAVLGASTVAWKQWLKPWLFPPSPLVVTPQIALESLESKSLFFNRLALPWLRERRNDLLTDEDRDPASTRARSFAQATQNPKLFRQLDRQYRFDAVLLIGDPSNYQRLLDHLLEPELDHRDFRLAYLDHWALVFKRNAPREWEPPDAEPLKTKLADLHSEDRAAFLAKAGAKMLSIRKIEPAKRWLDEAIAADGSSMDALSGLAGYYVSLGKWKEAETYADRALAVDADCIPAVAVKVLAMRATDHKLDALNFSERLNTLIPEDPVRLWQHAQIAHEAKAYQKEISALTRLVELAKAEGRPTGTYEFHLGEAHVFVAMEDATHAPLATVYLKGALLDPELPPDKRKFAEDRLKMIRERTGLE